MIGIRVVRLGGRKQKKPSKSKLPVFSEQDYQDALQDALVPKEEAIPTGFMRTYELMDRLGFRGRSGERKIYDMYREGRLERIELRRFGIDGRMKNCAFYKFTAKRVVRVRPRVPH